jgi:hypothetical protein
MDGFVSKPVVASVLIAEIERVLGNRTEDATGIQTAPRVKA